MLTFRTKSHHPFNTRPVIPAAVKQDHLTPRRQVRHITLKVPWRFLTFGGCRERYHPANARVQAFGNAFNHAPLTSCIPALKNDHNLQTSSADPFLQFYQLNLETATLLG